MMAWFMLGAAMVSALAMAQAGGGLPASMGASLLALPRRGAPLSFEQAEERTHELDGGASTVKIMKSKTWRDSYGRLRIDVESPNQPNSYTVLIDPVAGSRFLCLTADKSCYRTAFPKSDESKFAFMENGADLSGSSTARTENAGRRVIQEVEFEGTRIIQVVDGKPELTRTTEQWYSDDLKLIGSITNTSAQGTYVARIQNLRHGEPDPSLFAIPPDYTVHDIEQPGVP